MKNQLQTLRTKLDAYRKIVIDRVLLEEILLKFAPSYKISDLSQNGLITPIKRGETYINNFSRQEQDPYHIADVYFGGKNYAIGGLGIYNQYGFSTQVVEWHTIYNTKISGKRIIGKNKFIFRKQISSFFYGIETITQGNISYKVMSPERALIQMIRDKAILHSIPEGIDKEKLKKMASNHSTHGVYKKMKSLCS